MRRPKYVTKEQWPSIKSCMDKMLDNSNIIAHFIKRNLEGKSKEEIQAELISMALEILNKGEINYAITQCY